MLIDASKIIVTDRIRKEFGDLEELATDIEENGLINPPVVTTDNILVAGERRFRAMTEILGWKQIEVRPMTVHDALHQLKLEISENENRKEFTFSEKMDWASRLKEEYRKTAEANQKSGTSVNEFTQVGRVNDKVAKEAGFGSGRNLSKAEYIKFNADEEMIKKLDDNELSINAAYNQLKARAEDAEQKLKNATADVEKFKVIAVDAAKIAEGASKASEDSAEYLASIEKAKEKEKEARDYYEKWQDEKKKPKGLSDEEVKQKIKEATEEIKRQYQRQADDQQKYINELEDREPEVIERVPDDYNETKAELARLQDRMRSPNQSDFDRQFKRKASLVERTPEQLILGFEQRLVNETGAFLSVAKGLEVEFEYCPKISKVSKSLVRKSIEQLKQILEKMDSAIMEGESECRSA